MAVKHTPTNEVHKGTKGGKMGYGFDTREHASHWVATSERITCAKNGCKA
ncbi:hypothetical protein ACT3TC_11425 [Halomonas sp. AOP27-A1-41]